MIYTLLRRELPLISYVSTFKCHVTRIVLCLGNDRLHDNYRVCVRTIVVINKQTSLAMMVRFVSLVHHALVYLLTYYYDRWRLPNRSAMCFFKKSLHGCLLRFLIYIHIYIYKWFLIFYYQPIIQSILQVLVAPRQCLFIFVVA